MTDSTTSLYGLQPEVPVPDHLLDQDAAKYLTALPNEAQTQLARIVRTIAGMSAEEKVTMRTDFATAVQMALLADDGEPAASVEVISTTAVLVTVMDRLAGSWTAVTHG